MKLPIGIQTFEKLRTENYAYVDKTKEAYELINDYNYVFLARPRRFGKSLFLDTLKCIFEGKKELFKGLYIYNKWNFEKYPVIKIDWAGEFKSFKSLRKRAKAILNNNQERLSVECKDEDAINCFEELIQKAYKKYQKRVVILIDEYDKPILDCIEDKKQAMENRDFLRGFYSIMKANDEYIKFAFLTGVSKFSKASIFSGLNMLVDISLMPKFGNICGITQKEFEDNFDTDGVDLDKVKYWYNGYYFLKDKVYNPFDLLQYLKNRKFKNYWFASGNPYFLMELIKKRKYNLVKLSNLIVDEKILDVFDVERIDIEVLLYQAGYLSIKDVIESKRGTKYKLYFPNYEVKSSFNDYLIEYLIKDVEKEKNQDDLYEALLKGDIDYFISTLKRIFASIPYNNLTYIKGYEGFYASVVYVYLQSLGFDIFGKDITNKGRIDLSVFVEDKVYIIEFKVIDKKEAIAKDDCEALNQIKERNYHEKYQNREVYLIGICFSKKEKNIVDYEYESIKNV